MREARARLTIERHDDVAPPDGDSDDRLVARIARRDGEGFRALIDRHGSVPFRIGYRMLGEAGEAEDIAQEALLRLWRSAPRWRAGEGGVRAWLSRVAVNLALDRLRRRRFSSDAEPPDRPDDAPSADALIERDERRLAVRGCIAALSDRQRAAIVLTYYEELSNKMAADSLDLDIKAFESLLHRARAKLRACIEGKGIASGEENR